MINIFLWILSICSQIFLDVSSFSPNLIFPFLFYFLPNFFLCYSIFFSYVLSGKHLSLSPPTTTMFLACGYFRNPHLPARCNITSLPPPPSPKLIITILPQIFCSGKIGPYNWGWGGGGIACDQQFISSGLDKIIWSVLFIFRVPTQGQCLCTEHYLK